MRRGTSSALPNIDHKGRGLAHIAAAGGAVASLEWLADHQFSIDTAAVSQAEPTVVSRSSNLTGVTPLMLAALNGHADAVRFLLESRIARHSSISWLEADSRGLTAAHYAAMGGSSSVLSLLVTLADEAVLAPLEGAAAPGIKPILPAQRRVAALMLVHAARDCQGRTPLLVAAMCGRLELIRHILNNFSIFFRSNDSNNRPETTPGAAVGTVAAQRALQPLLCDSAGITLVQYAPPRLQADVKVALLEFGNVLVAP